MNQTVFGSVGGVTKKTQVLYESGERMPDAGYLAAVAAAGVDVLFVLTGQRADGTAQPMAVSPQLSPRVRALVDNYEHTDEAGKKIIEATATAAAQPTKAKRA